MKKDKEYTIYLLEREDGYRYVGITTNYKQRIYAHRSSKRFKELKIVNAIILETHGDQDVAINREKYWVAELDTYKNGLNLTSTGGADCGERFNTLGMSFVKGKRWCHDPKTGKHKAILDQSQLPDGWLMGRHVNGMKGRSHSHETRQAFSNARRGKPHKSKFNEDTIRRLFELYKSQPQLERVGEYVDVTKTLKRSYERAFALKYCKEFNMTSAYVHQLITKPSITWDYLWNEIIGKQKNATSINS